MVGAVRVLGRTEHDEEDELLRDVVEAMLDVGAHEHDRPCLHGAVLATHAITARPDTT